MESRDVVRQFAWSRWAERLGSEKAYLQGVWEREKGCSRKIVSEKGKFREEEKNGEKTTMRLGVLEKTL